MSAKVISFINLKGGVAKTTTTVGVAETLACDFGKKVLVIDLDPQTNATIMLIGEDHWFKLDRQGNTLATLFNDALKEEWNFNLDNSLQHGVGAGQSENLDLLPSSLRLIELQDKLITMPHGVFDMRHPVNIIYNRLKKIIDEYDYILIDCPPNLGFVTLNGLRISDGYIIPTIPDILSTYGIPQILGRVAKFSFEIDRNIEPLGVVATKYRKQTNIHKRILAELHTMAGKPYGKTNLFHPKVFETCFPDAVRFAEAAEHFDAISLSQRWGKNDYFYNFTQEIIKSL